MMYLFIYVLPLQPAEPARSAELPLTWAAHGENCSSSVRLSACPSRHQPQPKAEARQGKGRAERGHPEGAGGAAFTQPRVCPQGSPQGEAEPRDEAVGGSPAPLLGTSSSQHPACRAQLLQLPRCLRHPGVGWGWEEVGVWGGKCRDTSQSLSSVSGDALLGAGSSFVARHWVLGGGTEPLRSGEKLSGQQHPSCLPQGAEKPQVSHCALPLSHPACLKPKPSALKTSLLPAHLSLGWGRLGSYLPG